MLIGAVISFQMVTFGVIRGLVPAEQTGRALSAQNISFFGGAAIMQGSRAWRRPGAGSARRWPASRWRCWSAPSATWGCGERPSAPGR
ncbi:hypothetical protein ACFQY5_10445 [Paeniroseomonas aquatica]|uniref:hypothetical protein n=1 Tax=Paeniroseomonas aquatica TaxID=373043 RepID=UPI003616ABE8